MKKLYRFNTTAGTFYIAEQGGKFYPVFEDEPLGSYTTPEQVAEALAGGHTFSPSSGVDTSELGISEEVSEWERLR